MGVFQLMFDYNYPNESVYKICARRFLCISSGFFFFFPSLRAPVPFGKKLFVEPC